VDLESELTRFAEPIEPGNACGKSLEDTQVLAALEAYRIFGRLTPPESEPDWRALRSACVAALGDSKDLRVLAHLVAAVLRIDGLVDALRVLPVAGMWLTRYWGEVYPRIEDDAITRRNALALFADRVGVVDALRRAPIITNPQLGSFSLRDFDIAAGLLTPSGADTKPATTEQIAAALSAADIAALTEISQLASGAAAAFESVEETMRTRGGGIDAVPKLDLIVQALHRIHQVLEPSVAARTQVVPGVADPLPAGATTAAEVGTITSRQDVVRALDAVMNYYRRHEPSSLVPVLAERARRLVPMSFLETLAEIAPEALEPAKKAVGAREPSE
jgi:type VI secretion system protein ImpA